MTDPVPSKERYYDRFVNMWYDLIVSTAKNTLRYTRTGLLFTEADQEIERLRTCLTGISTCSTCEACRGAATRALAGVTLPGQCQPVFDRAGRCGTCTACGKNFTCGAALGERTTVEINAAVDERLDRVERELASAQPPGGGWDANGSPV